MNAIFKRLKHLFDEMLPPTVYFFIVLNIVALVRGLMALHSGVSMPGYASIAIAALILGKAVVIADNLPFINRYPNHPLIWNVAWKSAIYQVIAIAIHLLERLWDHWHVGMGLIETIDAVFSKVEWPRFWALNILLALFILMYCVWNEFARLIGRDKIKRMLYGPLPENLAPPQI